MERDVVRLLACPEPPLVHVGIGDEREVVDAGEVRRQRRAAPAVGVVRAAEDDRPAALRDLDRDAQAVLVVAAPAASSPK